ncbi:hypothetical protein Mth01_44580 [Sphaerimonospora thailandensis]|uniref:Uncharacterized protein n=1 Tax=Sphaerimonospora thailandensis TaxID=795644 RepID=A0A8J3RCC6_9ACTN|nr:hypothetical protein Mth01_44580 [Sphaerimonospora thailandensis]
MLDALDYREIPIKWTICDGGHGRNEIRTAGRGPFPPDLMRRFRMASSCRAPCCLRDPFPELASEHESGADALSSRHIGLLALTMS